MAKYRQPKQKDYSWLWGIAIIVGLLFLARGSRGNGASGPNFPFDDAAQEDSDLSQEYWEGRQEVESIENDPCAQDIMDGVPPEYQRCNDDNVSQSDSASEVITSDSSGECPGGCTNHKAGCDIKGNISFDSGEKIYHVPGGEFYSATTINPKYGERWFCTESEAIASGWRESRQ